MHFRKYLPDVLTVVFLLFSVPNPLQAQLKLNGEYRPRSELRNGYRLLDTPQTDPAFFISQRTRFNILYNSDLYTLKIAAQDVRTWGDVEQLGDQPNVNIHEAWGQLNLSERWRVKLGRQELVYNDHRLLGSVNWTQQARSHDIFRAMYKDSETGLRVHAGAAYNQESQRVLGNSYRLNNYKMLTYSWARKEFGPVDASALFITDGFEVADRSVKYRYTYGTHIVYQDDALNLTGTLYLQNGDDAARRNISAFMAAARASYDFDALKLTAGYDYLSGGDSDDVNPRRKTFNTLYATNHKFYGFMDYFLNIPADTHGGGLSDLYIRADYPLFYQAGLQLTYHHFSLANTVNNPVISQPLDEKGLASEVDLVFSYKWSDDISFKLGYSALNSKNALREIQDRSADGLQHWGWAMIVLTPSFLTSGG